MRTAYRTGITPAHAGKSGTECQLAESEQDHPRTRGEKFGIMAGETGAGGSPPHTRGKGRQRRSDRENGGITPAHAGKSTATFSINSGVRDHPRTRGEKNTTPTQRNSAMGSPPHTRGKAILEYLQFEGIRITPAHAGKS